MAKYMYILPTGGNLGGRKLISAPASQLMSLGLADRYPALANLLVGHLNLTIFSGFLLPNIPTNQPLLRGI